MQVNPMFTAPSGRFMIDMDHVIGLGRSEQTYGGKGNEQTSGDLDIFLNTSNTLITVSYDLNSDNDRALFEQDWEATSKWLAAIYEED